MPSKYEDALSALGAERDSLQARLAEVNTAIDALRAVAQAAPAAAPARRRPGRPRKAAAPAPAAPQRRGRPAAKAAAKKPAGRRGRKPRGAAKKPAAPKLEPRIEEYFASNPKRQSTAQEIGAALGADQRAVRLSLGRMAKKNKATRMDDGSYRAYSG